MGSSGLVKSRKLNHTFRFPRVFGSCNSKMLLVKSWDRIHFEKFIIIRVTRKDFYYYIPFLLTLFSQNVASDFSCNNSFDAKTIKFNRLHNRNFFLFHVSFKLVWLKREIKNISPYFIIFQVRYTAIIFHKH